MHDVVEVCEISRGEEGRGALRLRLEKNIHGSTCLPSSPWPYWARDDPKEHASTPAATAFLKTAKTRTQEYGSLMIHKDKHKTQPQDSCKNKMTTQDKTRESQDKREEKHLIANYTGGLKLPRGSSLDTMGRQKMRKNTTGWVGGGGGEWE